MWFLFFFVSGFRGRGCVLSFYVRVFFVLYFKRVILFFGGFSVFYFRGFYFFRVFVFLRCVFLFFCVFLIIKRMFSDFILYSLFYKMLVCLESFFIV